MKPCFCGRAPSGFAFIDFNPVVQHRRPIQYTCSMACLDILGRNKGVAPTPHEKQAVEAASEAIGAYLEQLGKTDLAQMTAAEWQGFLEHAFLSVALEIRNIAYQDTPF